MSETYCEIILYQENPKELIAAKQLLSPRYEDKNNSFGEYQIESSVVAENTIIASICGLLYIDELLSKLSNSRPEWLYFYTYDSKVGHEESWCLKNGTRKSTLKTLTQSIRKKSRQADLYFAIINQEKNHLSQLLKDDSVSPDLFISGAPLVYYIMAWGGVRLLKQLMKAGQNFHERVQQTRWIDAESLPLFEVVRGMNLLAIAIKLESVAALKFLIDTGIDVNAVDENGNTPINIAAEDRSKHKFIEPLIKAGANINHVNKAGFTPIFSLLHHSEYTPIKTIATLEKWIEYGADIQHTSHDGSNALWLVMNKSTELQQFVKSKGINEYRVPDCFYDDMSLAKKLEKCIWQNDIHSFQEVMHDLDINSLNKEEQRDLLHLAAREGRLEIVRLMIQHGIPPYLIKNKYYFAYQITEGHRNVAKYLKEQMKHFFAERKKRVKMVRPLYNRLMSALAEINQQQSANKNFSPLGAFQAHPFMKKYTQDQLKHWAYISVLYQQKRLSTRMDDEFNVIFRRGASPESFVAEGSFEVKISTECSSEPLIMGFL